LSFRSKPARVLCGNFHHPYPKENMYLRRRRDRWMSRCAAYAQGRRRQPRCPRRASCRDARARIEIADRRPAAAIAETFGVKFRVDVERRIDGARKGAPTRPRCCRVSNADARWRSTRWCLWFRKWGD
jgi:hypothetical protein